MLRACSRGGVSLRFRSSVRPDAVERYPGTARLRPVERFDEEVREHSAELLIFVALLLGAVRHEPDAALRAEHLLGKLAQHVDARRRTEPFRPERARVEARAETRVEDTQ